MLALVAAWVVPYARSGPVQALGARLASEVGQRTTDRAAADALRHLVLYPLVLVGAAAPWSLLLLPLATRPGRNASRGLLDDAWLALCGAVVAWGVLVFAFVPGTLPRYLIPVLPAAAPLAAAALRLDRPSSIAWPWAALAAAWATLLPLGGARPVGGPPRPAGRAAHRHARRPRTPVVASTREVARRFGATTAALLASALLYGLAYAGVAEPRAEARGQDEDGACTSSSKRRRRSGPTTFKGAVLTFLGLSPGRGTAGPSRERS
jgi:hypothetical protein